MFKRLMRRARYVLLCAGVLAVALAIAPGAAMAANAPLDSSPAPVPTDGAVIGGAPLDVVFDTAGTAYVSNYDYDGGIRVIPKGAASYTRNITTGHYVSSLAIGADNTLYAVQEHGDAGGSEIAVIAPGGSAVARTIALESGLGWMGIAPDGTLYIPNRQEKTVSVVLPGGTAIARTVGVGSGASAVAVGSDGTAYVANLWAASVSVIPPGSATVSRTISLGDVQTPHGIAVTSDGTLYVGCTTTKEVLEVLPGGTKPTRSVSVGFNPGQVTAAPDGIIYVANADDDFFSVITPQSAAAQSIPAIGHPGRMAVAPDGTVHALVAGMLVPLALAPVSSATPSPIAAQAQVSASAAAMSILPSVAATIGLLLCLGAAIVVMTGRRRRSAARPEEH